MNHMYGVYYEDNQWMLGRSTVKTDGDDNRLHIECVHYIGTPGLYERLFMKHLKKNIYNEDDLRAYKNILRALFAHKRYHDVNAQLR